jgi:hypothetical protein
VPSQAAAAVPSQAAAPAVPALAVASPAEVRLRIGELALHGVPVTGADRLGPALAAALDKLLRERGVPASWSDGAAPSRPRPVTVVADRSGNPELLARRLALALYEGLGG